MRLRQFVITESTLFEINMSPGNLAKLASEIDARVGMEFEMVVPVQSYEYDDDYESEPDFDQNERVRGMYSIEQFFHDGDFNSRRTVERVMAELQQEYLESDSFIEDQNDAFREEADYYLTKIIESELGEEFEELAQARADARPEGFYKTDRDRQDAVNLYMSDLVQERVEQSMEEEDNYYAQAREQWLNEGDFDYSDRMDHWVMNEYGTMTDVMDAHNVLNWPYWTEPDQEEAEPNVDAIADSFRQAIGRNVRLSRSYHGTKRDDSSYIIEPDSSIQIDANEAGLEFVSPPLSLADMAEDLEAVRTWAKETGCTTNRSTGLHINVSVPGIEPGKIDYVKLALLLGDRYVLEQFDRSSNHFCKSALDEIQSRAKTNTAREAVPAMLDSMRAGLNRIASKIVHSGSTGKYISINNKEKYIEFRSPGGDWLNTDLANLTSTMNRFVVALDAAVDENKYREEYSKKLYKLIQPAAGNNNTIDYFVKYVSGQIPKQALKSFLKQANLQRDYERKKIKPGTRAWYKVYAEGKRQTSGASVEVVATSEEEAINKALEHWRSNRAEKPRIEAEVIRPYEEQPIQARVSAAGPSQRAWEPTPLLTAPDTHPDANWAILRKSDNQPVHYFTRNTREEAQDTFMRVVGSAYHLYRLAPVTPRTSQSQETPVPGSTVDLQRQRTAAQDQRYIAPENNPDANWAIIRRSDGEIILYFYRNDRESAENYMKRSVSGNDWMYTIIPIQPRNRDPNDVGEGNNFEIVDNKGAVVHRFRADSFRLAQERFNELIIGTDRLRHDLRRARSTENNNPRVGQQQGEFTGQWNVSIDGQVVTQVQAATQGQANAAAHRWVSSQSNDFMNQHQGGEVTVTPVYA